jgi:hypothetical protein
MHYEKVKSIGPGGNWVSHYRRKLRLLMYLTFRLQLVRVPHYIPHF